MKEKLAGLLVMLMTLGVPGSIFWYQDFWLPRHSEPGVRVITLTAMGGSAGVYTLEEINGLNYWWKDFTPATLFLSSGEKVLLKLQSADVTHQFYVPELGLGPLEIRPGHPRELEFVADRAGLFQYFCTTVCGPCHYYMSGWIVVTPAGSEPTRPQPVLCPDCFASLVRPPPSAQEALGEYLYLTVGCVACHGPTGRGGVANPNYAKQTIPSHNNTAEKLFLRTPEAAELFLLFLANGGEAAFLEDIPLGQVVSDRHEALKKIIRNGSQPERLDPQGPQPPLWMPAWRYRLEEPEIDALVAYFISLASWDEDLDEVSQ